MGTAGGFEARRGGALQNPIHHVNMLGDADNDGKITSADSMSLSKWFANSDLDSYDTIYDMNKDGFIDGDDFALLRGAVVRDDSYLDI